MEALQLGPLDAAYLALDGPTTTGNICLLMPLDGRVRLTTLRRQLLERLPALPELRWRVREVLWGMDRPWWIEDVDFDLDRHLVEHTVLEVGDLDTTGLLVADLSMRHLDRDHPLWQIHLLHEPHLRRSSVLTVLHHAMADGHRMREILQVLFGPRRPHRPPASDDAPGVPEDAEQARPGSLTDAALVSRSVLRTGQWAWEATLRTAKSAASLPASIVHSALLHLPEVPPTPFNRAVSDRRSWAYGTVELARSKAVRRAHGVTVNDLVHSIVAAAVREWLVARDALPDAPLATLVPIAARHPHPPLAEESGVNHLALAVPHLPTHLADPVERLRAAHDAMAHGKARPWLDETSLDVIGRLLHTSLRWGTYAASTLRLHDSLKPVVNLVVSNVPMFDDQFRVGRHTVVAVYPMPPIFEGIGLNVTLQGYQGRLDIGVAACADLVPDVAALVDWMRTEYDRLCDLG